MNYIIYYKTKYDNTPIGYLCIGISELKDELEALMESGDVDYTTIEIITKK